MAKILGTEVNIGIASEFTAGTAKAATAYPKWLDFSMQGVSEKSIFKGQRGLRNEGSDTMIKRKYSMGSISVVPDVDIVPYFFKLALGSWSSATHAGESVVYDHTITVQNAGASLPTMTLLAEQGAIETAQYVNVACDALNLEVSDDYAKLTAELIGKFPSTGTVTETFTQPTLFAYHQMTAKFGVSLSAAAGNSATPLKAFSLNIKNNIQMDEAFLSGSNDIQTGGLVGGRLQITGSYTLHFSDTVELAKYRANTLNALVVSFTGANIGVVPTAELIKISLGRLVLTKPPLVFKLDNLTVLTQDFQVNYDATDKEIAVLVTNGIVGTTYAPTS